MPSPQNLLCFLIFHISPVLQPTFVSSNAPLPSSTTSSSCFIPAPPPFGTSFFVLPHRLAPPSIPPPYDLTLHHLLFFCLLEFLPEMYDLLLQILHHLVQSLLASLHQQKLSINESHLLLKSFFLPFQSHNLLLLYNDSMMLYNNLMYLYYGVT